MWSRLEDFLRYNPGARHRRRLVRRALRKHAPAAKEVLDVGCGLGEMVGYLANEFPQVNFTGVDFSSGAIEFCRRRQPSRRWEVADVVADELPGPFDAIVCSELLEHLDDPESALKRIAGSLAPGGTIVVTVPHGKVFATERSIGHVQHPAVPVLREWFRASRLTVVEARRWGWPAYLALKHAANIDPERALEALGSGKYSWPIRRANDLAYVAVGVASLPNASRGPQTVIVGRRTSV
jgi:SAM-dependent methyltransferase